MRLLTLLLVDCGVGLVGGLFGLMHAASLLAVGFGLVVIVILVVVL